jgi:hypothetical protein
MKANMSATPTPARVGACTQDPRLRAKFTGTESKIDYAETRRRPVPSILRVSAPYSRETELVVTPAKVTVYKHGPLEYGPWLSPVNTRDAWRLLRQVDAVRQ